MITFKIKDFIVREIFMLSLPSAYDNVGITYINRAGDYVQIIGEVTVTTAEYQMGFRYYDNLGSFYTSDGRTNPMEFNSKASDLIKVADRKVIPLGILMGLALPGPVHSEIKTIPSDHLDFKVRIGGSYVNRMKIRVDITDFIQGDRRNGIPDRFAGKGQSHYFMDGRVFISKPSMHDLIKQIIEDPVEEPAEDPREEPVEHEHGDCDCELRVALTHHIQAVKEISAQLGMDVKIFL